MGTDLKNIILSAKGQENVTCSTIFNLFKLKTHAQRTAVCALGTREGIHSRIGMMNG